MLLPAWVGSRKWDDSRKSSERMWRDDIIAVLRGVRKLGSSVEYLILAEGPIKAQ